LAKEVIAPADVVPARGFSHAIKAGKTVFVAGQTATDEAGKVIGKGDMIAQTDRAYENVARVLKASGASITDVVKMNIFVTDMDAFAGTGEPRKKHFGRHFPASTVVQIERLLDPEAMIEVEAIAVID
jgi:reactive intermediate/imine deaminase